MIWRTLTITFTVFALLACGDADTSQPWDLTERAPTPREQPDDQDADPSESEDADPAPTEEAEPEEEPEPEPEEEPGLGPGAEFFTGRWMVDQPFHATYEAELYDFQADGRLVGVEVFSFGGSDDRTPVGKVAECREYQTYTWEQCDGDDCVTHEHEECVEYGAGCVFGDKWWSRAETELAISLECDDGRDRDLFLDFGEVPETTWLQPISIEVTGSGDWEHPSFQWAWHRCQDLPESDCELPD